MLFCILNQYFEQFVAVPIKKGDGSVSKFERRNDRILKSLDNIGRTFNEPS